MKVFTPSLDLGTPLLISVAVHLIFVAVIGLSRLPTVMISPPLNTLTVELKAPIKHQTAAIVSTTPAPFVTQSTIASKAPLPRAAIARVQPKNSPSLPKKAQTLTKMSDVAAVNQATMAAMIHDTLSLASSNTASTSSIIVAENVSSVITSQEQAPIFDAAYLNNPPPSYPVFAKKRQQQGIVMLKVKVSTEGKPELVELEQSSGFPLLDMAAQQTVEKWHFVPARRDDVVISTWVQVPVQFKLI